jgi:hypothetical protein
LAVPKLGPPPLRIPFMLNGQNNPAWTNWFQTLFIVLGSGTGVTSLTAAALSGSVTTANIPVGLAANVTNDAWAEPTDIDATNTTIWVHGGATGVHGADWNVWQDTEIILANIAPTNFPNCKYATDYYIGYDTVTQDWNIAETYSAITGDNVVRFHCRTHDSNGVTGSGVSGGGAAAGGGFGGYKVGFGGGFGQTL